MNSGRYSSGIKLNMMNDMFGIEPLGSVCRPFRAWEISVSITQGGASRLRRFALPWSDIFQPFRLGNEERTSAPCLLAPVFSLLAPDS